MKSPLTWDAIFAFIFVVWLLIVTLTGCKMDTYREDDNGKLQKNLPSAEELRPVCPM